VRQDLSKLFEAVKARGSNAGRAAIDPRVLFALWLYATLQGVGSGREVARLSHEHDAYRWICGGVSVNYHAINDLPLGQRSADGRTAHRQRRCVGCSRRVQSASRPFLRRCVWLGCHARFRNGSPHFELDCDSISLSAQFQTGEFGHLICKAKFA